LNANACGGSSAREMVQAGGNSTSIFNVSCFPNPVFSSVTISFSLAQSENVSFRIYDVSGRLISTLADILFEEGENKVIWNASEVRSGIYFLRIQTEKYSETLKISLVK
jgi:hypothetical protein